MSEKQSQTPKSEPAELVVRQDEKTESAEKVDPLAWLSPAERYAYEYFVGSMGKLGSKSYPLAESVREQLMELYFQGKTMSEIRKLNPQFSMGQVVHAAVEGFWNRQREDYLALTVNRAKTRAVQAAAEGVDLVADMMAAIRKLHGDNIARFLQTGDVSALGPATSMASIRQLKELAEVLMRLTGQDQKRSVTVNGEVKHSGTVTTVPTSPPKALAPHEAASVLKGWAVSERKKIEIDLKG